MGRGLLTHYKVGHSRIRHPFSIPLLSEVLHCQLSAEEVMFPVSVTQQSPAAVSMETYHVTLTLPPTQVEWGVGNGVGQGVV